MKKLGRTAEQRMAMIRTQASELLGTVVSRPPSTEPKR